MTLRTAIVPLDRSRGRLRLRIEGRFLPGAGFPPGRPLRIEAGPDRLTVRPQSASDPVRSPADVGIVTGSRRGGGAAIELTGAALRPTLSEATEARVRTSPGEIVVTPCRPAQLPGTVGGTVGSAFSGGGLLDEAARLAGYRSLFGVEIEPAFADIWQANHPGHMHQGCISRLDLRALPRVDLLVMGLPCAPFSAIRRQAGNQRRRADLPEEHELADLSLWALLLVEAVRPATVLIEQVPPWLRSGVGIVTQNALKRMGFVVESRVFDGTEFGALTRRKRCVILASRRPIRWPQPCPGERSLAELLLPPDHPDCRWFDRSAKPWLFEHWDRQTARGNSFAAQQLTPGTRAVQAITRRYFAGQGDNPVVKDVRPGRDGWFRWLTLGEVRRIMGLRDDYDLGPALTTAGEVLGQGVLVEVFRRIIEAAAPLEPAGQPGHAADQGLEDVQPEEDRPLLAG